MSTYGLKSSRDAFEFFKALKGKSTIVKARDLLDINFPQQDQTTEFMVCREFLQDVGETIGFGKGKVHLVMGMLYRVGAVTALSRSTPYSPGTVLINFEPTLEQFIDNNKETSATDKRISPGKIDSALMEVRVLRNRITELEKDNKKHKLDIKDLKETLSDIISQMKKAEDNIPATFGDVGNGDDVGGSPSLS